ncbi:Uu.00g041990.m01.CDS01 [Anthostomella pinea]|uniref:Uu.00g041990.m01.CDS01 n=1 Tax=Anthostomella pinea TaxID=933095 RepID=A0AAI8YDZ7_9PEZI|nr:Uu.00g041990.m01.CDS01 [Anthostomella pinea]
MATTTSNIRSALPPSCAVSTPSSDDTVYTFLSKRWSTLGPSTLPAAAVVPSTEDDVVAIVQFAAANGLKVLPQCGACGGLVITTAKTLYVDMEKFREVDVDRDARTVTFGGGALAGDVQPAVTAKGFYTGWPNMGIVGMVGNVLGGGLNLFKPIKGLTCDNLISARFVTASGDIVEVSSESTGAEKQLFNLLKGAGAGFGVILSLTMRIYPTAELGLADGTGISEVMAMFAREDFDAAAKLWEMVSQSPSPMSVIFVFMAAPPNMSIAGQPVIMAQGMYPGPASEAQKAFAPFNAPGIKDRAIMVKPGTTQLETMNAQRDAMAKKGRNMDVYNGLVYNLSPETLLRAANKFAEFVDTHGAAVGRTNTGLHPMHPETLLRTGGAGEDSFMCHRDRNFNVQTAPWDLDDDFVPVAQQHGREMLELLRGEDRAKGIPNAILAGNARVETDMTEILSPEKLDILRKQKAEWDPKGVFWNAAVDGWAV